MNFQRTDIVGHQSQGIAYDARSGQYRSLDSGQYVPRSHVLQLLEQEATRLEVRLAAHTRVLASDKIDLAEWERRMATDLQLSHLRTSMLAAGGKGQMTQQLYGVIGHQLRRQYQYLHGFAQDLHDGKLTADGAIKRAKMYGTSVKASFSRSEQIARANTGTYLAKRVLDPQSKHCEDCIRYAQPKWVPLEQIAPIAANCRCMSRCRCRILYRQVASLQTKTSLGS